MEMAIFTGIFIILLGVVIWLFIRQSKTRGEGSSEVLSIVAELKAQNMELAGRLSQIAEDGRKSQSELSKVLEGRLDKVSERLGKSLEDSSTKSAKSMGEIQTRLKVIDDAQKKMQELSGDIIGLQDILSNKQKRGGFGEIQLNDLVSNILPPNAYSFQTTLSNGKRPDCLLQLPNPPGPIVVDAKFPLEGYRALLAAKDENQKKEASRLFKDSIKGHVKAIAEKYIILGETAESALMFLPSEAVYAEMHANFPEVVEESYKARVWIVSPTTLMATLNTIRAVLKDVRMREQAGVIQKEMGMLLKDVILLDKRVSQLDKHFDLATRDVKDIQISTGKISKRSKNIQDVQLEDIDGVSEIEETATPRLVKSD